MPTSKTKNTPATEPAAVTLHTRGRDWPVELTPAASHSGYASFRQLRIARDTAAALVLAPTLGARAFGLLFLAFGGGIVGAYVHMFADAKMMAQFPKGFWGVVGGLAACSFGALLGGMCLWMSTRMLTQNVRFDKAAGSLTRRWLLRTVSVRALEEVIGVQLLALGRMTIGGGGRGGSCTVDMWQVNVVLEFPPAATANVCTEPDATFCKETARRLAAFLGVPLVEGVAAGARK